MNIYRFKGKQYLLIGTLHEGGPLATKHQYETYSDSFAHLFGNGEIKRYNVVIGHRRDLKLVRRCKAGEVNSGAGLISYFERQSSPMVDLILMRAMMEEKETTARDRLPVDINWDLAWLPRKLRDVHRKARGRIEIARINPYHVT